MKIATAMRRSVVLLLAVLASCADAKDSIQQAADYIDNALGVAETSEHHPEAQANEAEQFYRGALASRETDDAKTAAALFRRSADLGHAAAAYELGLAYSQGLGVEQDLEAASQWFNLAAERGDARAQYLVGATYLGAAGGDADAETAVRYLASAAVQGHPRAQYLLAEAFASGRGVPKDLPWAARWYGKAAHQGHSEAQFAYGVMWAAGRGLPKNRVIGLAWLTLAAKAGHQEAERVRAAVFQRASGAERARAEARARGFKVEANAQFADAPTVVYVQQSLNRLGYAAGSVDGLVGPRTRKAIEAFQRAEGLDADGSLTPEFLERVLARSRA